MEENKLPQLKTRLDEVNSKLADPNVYASTGFKTLKTEQKDLTSKIEQFEQIKKTKQELLEAKELVGDAEMAEFAREEVIRLEAKLKDLQSEVRLNMVSTDPSDQKNAILEIRAGAGGDESSLFATELARMYLRYLERKGFKISLMSSSPSDVGGYKEAIFEVRGEGAYHAIKYESGVHRVQRVPETESSGRVHTSTVTVAVLPEAEESELEISPSNLRIDVFKSSGHGGQSVNTTDSAVRVTHLPTGIVVTCQDEKSQLKNKTKAISILRSRLLAKKKEEETKQLKSKRMAQIGTGDRSEKIRTYNFPQDRVTDHRINFSTGNLAGLMDGEIDKLVEALKKADIEAKLANAA
ncbi:MAG: peptide chain release factor 1 [bacterium]|nr:peptide chain release factor 1 [bacterium]